ncbi:hypothetical protein SRHO_G00279060 [Serrasalmus rhombeus]
MSTAFEALQQATVFTKLDLYSAYNLIRIQQGDEWKTAFITPTGHYEYQINALQLNERTSGLPALHNSVYFYLDNILIYSHSLKDDVRHVRQILQLLLENHLYIKLEKSVFHVSMISFLGFVVSTGTLRMGPAKIRAVVDWPCHTLLRYFGLIDSSLTKFSSSPYPPSALLPRQPASLALNTHALIFIQC